METYLKMMDETIKDLQDDIETLRNEPRFVFDDAGWYHLLVYGIDARDYRKFYNIYLKHRNKNKIDFAKIEEEYLETYHKIISIEDITIISLPF